MAEIQRRHTPLAGGVLLGTAVFGALAGAGGLAWWLWRQGQRRAANRATSPSLAHRSRFGASSAKGGLADGLREGDGLPDRVQQLNQAIEDVRRQLEALHSQP